MENLENKSFKDFENIPGLGPDERACEWAAYVDNWQSRGHWNYRQESFSGCGPVAELRIAGNPHQQFVSLVSNDYLGFTQHPKVKAAAIAAIEQYGTGAGASPAIGGHYHFHREIEESIAAFFKRESAIVYTTGYTANSAMLQCLLKKEDLAILDMAVHASVQEGCILTNIKTFPHNNLEALERILRISQDQYRTRMVIIDGVYSQDGDLAPLYQIVALCKLYGAYIVVDDAHGTGVIGETGRGVIELYDLFQEIDIITGTFSKSFAHVGGYVVAKPGVVEYLKFHSRQHIFSATLPPAAACISTAIRLVDDEPEWQHKLWANIRYFKNGLLELGLDTGNTASAIIPVKTGDPQLAAEATKLLLEAGVYANQIGYPAVSKKDARVRMSLMATHTQEHLDQVLNAWQWVDGKLKVSQLKPIAYGYKEEAT
ncbi:aminotransferase class I/II-fold pyridoxal phosphate-dependent enzyme [Mucilaginibacter sp. R-33]|uniref:aminotransferase class I/II-fold pyridoxal phosphate-dependent enzyme n=1 Tax=Mucilaginibacter sp. R-33 TaxID=3416711 RepID=UPI003CF3EE77